MSGKILAGLIGLFTATVIVASTGWWTSQFAYGELQSIVADRVEPLAQLKAVSDLYAVDIVDTTHKLRNGGLDWPAAAASIANATRGIEKNWAAYAGTMMTAEEKALAGAVMRTKRESDAAVAELVGIVAARDRGRLDAFVVGRLYQAIDPTTEAIGKLTDIQVSVARAEFARASATFDVALLVIGAAILLSAAAFAFALWVSLYQVLRPLGQMTAAMGRLAGGDNDTAVPHRGRSDEVGAMAAALQVFKEGAIERNRLEQAEKDAAALRRARRELLERAIAGFRDSATGLLARLGSGTEQMRSAVADVAGYSDDATARAQEAAAATEEATANVQAVASAAEELSTSIAEISAKISHTRLVIDETNRITGDSDRHIQSLATASERIGNIVGLIQAIAAQTNLLALNATIEAARAGDAGRGFAVVASEVKNLAGQTGKATQEIAEQIGAIQSATGTAVDSIRAIAGRMTAVQEFTTAIASAVEEQSAATGEIAANVNRAAEGTAVATGGVGGVTLAVRSTNDRVIGMRQTAAAVTGQVAEFESSIAAFLQAVATD